MGDDVQKTSPHREAPWPRLTETKGFRRMLSLVRWSGLFLFGSCAVAILAILVLKSQPLPPPIQPFTTKLYSGNGQLISELHQGERREYVPLSEMPEAFVNAVLAVEDRHFYDHFGISPKGILRAVWTDIKAGALVEGGSTITQQLARNLYLNHDRTWTRKLKELKYALQLEIHFSKEHILEMYLNEVYFGHQTYGLKEAARLFFGKQPEELTIAESTMLAGIPKGAGVYSPYINPEKAKERQWAVLASMVQQNELTKKEAEEIWNEPLQYKRPQKTAVTAPYFRDYVQTVAAERFELPREQIEKGGLNIFTTLDPQLQQLAERAVSKYIGRDSKLQAALIAVNPKNGHIVAMVGGTDYGKSQFNRTLAERQPGSAFKPFLYLAALERGMTPVSQYESAPTTFSADGQQYTPQNYNGVYAHRPITMREAIARSDNVYAVKTHFDIGRHQLVEAAQKLGIKRELPPYPSLALGSVPVTPLELAEAYTTIARQGSHVPLTPITRITDPYGDVLVDVRSVDHRVTSPATAFVLTELMRGVFEDTGGTGQIIRHLLPARIAGKTGSTNWDSWLAGFSPELVTVVWVGYDQNEPLAPNEARIAKWIWGTFMSDASRHNPPVKRHVPPGVIAVSIDPETGLRATENCPTSRNEYFVSGTEPSATCHLHGGTKKVPRIENEHSSDTWLNKLKKWWRHRQ